MQKPKTPKADKPATEKKPKVRLAMVTLWHFQEMTMSHLQCCMYYQGARQ
jgi:hypothetical protein